MDLAASAITIRSTPCLRQGARSVRLRQARLAEERDDPQIRVRRQPCSLHPLGARQRTELSKAARDLLAKLAIEPPRKIHELSPPPGR
jgi:hypothetical protein